MFTITKTNYLKNQFDQIPQGFRIFLTRAFFIFIAWKILYYSVLFPTRFPERQLTTITARVTAWVYQQITHTTSSVIFTDGQSQGHLITSVYVNNVPIINIGDGCNAFSLFVIYTAFLFCLRSSINRKLFFIFLGLPVIFITNTFRCVVLLYLKSINNHFFDFFHHYLFYVLVYGIIFFLWWLYSQKINFAS